MIKFIFQLEASLKKARAYSTDRNRAIQIALELRKPIFLTSFPQPKAMHLGDWQPHSYRPAER